MEDKDRREYLEGLREQFTPEDEKEKMVDDGWQQLKRLSKKNGI